MSSKKELLIEKLIEFYSDKNNLNTFIEIVKNNSSVSLRLLDWFSTNYAKDKNIYISDLDIYTNYKGQLKGFTKLYFDPFKRNERVFLKNKNNKPLNSEEIDLIVSNEPSEHSMETTVGQMNFFRWCIEKGIMSYIINNRNDIEKSMSLKKKLKCSLNTMSKKDIKIVITFN